MKNHRVHAERLTFTGRPRVDGGMFEWQRWSWDQTDYFHPIKTEWFLSPEASNILRKRVWDQTDFKYNTVLLHVGGFLSFLSLVWKPESSCDCNLGDFCGKRHKPSAVFLREATPKLRFIFGGVFSLCSSYKLNSISCEAPGCRERPRGHALTSLFLTVTLKTKTGWNIKTSVHVFMFTVFPLKSDKLCVYLRFRWFSDQKTNLTKFGQKL